MFDTWNFHNIVSQLYSIKKKKKEKRNALPPEEQRPKNNIWLPGTKWADYQYGKQGWSGNNDLTFRNLWYLIDHDSPRINRWKTMKVLIFINRNILRLDLSHHNRDLWPLIQFPFLNQFMDLESFEWNVGQVLWKKESHGFDKVCIANIFKISSPKSHLTIY